MIKKTISYTDFNGNAINEDAYFNLNTAELAELYATWGKDPAEALKSLVDENDIPGMFAVINAFIRKSYGVKSEDGKRFKKSEELADEFFQSCAYEALFDELISSPDALERFINGCLPAGIVAEMNAHPELLREFKRQ